MQLSGLLNKKGIMSKETSDNTEKEKTASHLEKLIQEEIWNTVIDTYSEKQKRKKPSDSEEENIRKLIELTDLSEDEIRSIAFRARKRIISEEEKKKKQKTMKNRKIKTKTIIAWIIAISILGMSVFLIGKCIKNSIDGDNLCEAAEYGNYDRIKTLLDRGANINAKDYLNRTALMVAAEYGHSRIVQLLVEQGANLKARDYYKRTAIDYAEKNNKQENVDILGYAYVVSTPRGSAARQLWEMGYPFSHESFFNAVKERNLDAVELFLSLDLDPLDDYDHYESALEAAVSYNCPGIVQLFLPEIPKKTKEQVASAFHDAVKDGRKDIIEMFIGWGINLKKLARYELYPLLEVQDYEIMKLLLENGMDVNIRDKQGKSALIRAVTENEIPASDRIALVKLLLTYGADPNVSDQNGRLVDQAAIRGNTEIIQLLYESGAEE